VWGHIRVNFPNQQTEFWTNSTGCEQATTAIVTTNWKPGFHQFSKLHDCFKISTLMSVLCQKIRRRFLLKPRIIKCFVYSWFATNYVTLISFHFISFHFISFHFISFHFTVIKLWRFNGSLVNIIKCLFFNLIFFICNQLVTFHVSTQRNLSII
jgi:hypothetical protein